MGRHSTVMRHSPATIFFAVPPWISPMFNVVYGGSKSRFFRVAIFRASFSKRVTMRAAS